MRDTWDSDVLEFIAPGAEDLVVDKNRYDAFLYTDLELLLRNLGISHLVVTGVVTHVCVETTVRSADQRGFRATVASDATAANSDQLHEGSLRAMASVFASVRTTGQILADDV